MYDFTYHRPASLDEVARLTKSSEDPKVLAGGMSLLPTLKQRLSKHSDLVDLAGIGDLAGIRRDADALVIGAMTRHADVAASSEVKAAIPALAILAEGIGDPLVRNRGTMGGSIANADPAADYPSAVLGLGATVVTNRRSIAADDFFKGLFETALAPDEIITAVRYPIPDKAGYTKFPEPGLALCHRRRVRRPHARRLGEGRRDRCGPVRVPPGRGGGAAEGALRARGARRPRRQRARPQHRHPRQRRIPRSRDRGDGEARRRPGGGFHAMIDARSRADRFTTLAPRTAMPTSPPLPLAGEGWGGGTCRLHQPLGLLQPDARAIRSIVICGNSESPLPTPPPQAGEGKTGAVAPPAAQRTASRASIKKQSPQP